MLRKKNKGQRHPGLESQPSQSEGNQSVSMKLRASASPRATIRRLTRGNAEARSGFRRVLLTLFLGWIATDLFAQDVIELNNDKGQPTKRSGQIIDWKANQISLKTKTRTRKINALQVTNIQTQWPVELEDARRLMRSGKFDEAVPKLKTARENENRAWVQQIITAELAQSLDALDQTEAAAIEVLRLYQDDPQTRFFHLIPLPWLLSQQYPPEGRMGKKMLKSNNSFLALISASLLLNGSERETATQRLQQLTTSPDPRIAQLATVQLWRNELLTADKNTVERWQRQISRLPDNLRAGPVVLLAQAQSRVGVDDAAAINFMKLPILYPEKKSL